MDKAKNIVQVVINGQVIGSIFPSNGVWFAELPEGVGMHFTSKVIAADELLLYAAKHLSPAPVMNEFLI